ncbi:hypothetical protein FOA52_000567 [Chlamydomonas sp. UWO 241]|nr:hypothetical protein FOA52_000567 [Chlamydomonas sp. UWO 241]
MFWKVNGFSQQSPLDVILDKGSFTLEELLDEDDLIQGCSTLRSARLVQYLRERNTVEQLLRYLVEPPRDSDDQKMHKYPFASCEVLCCESDMVYNTLLDEPDLLSLLFSMLDAPPPLSCKAAGYFGRVVGTLLVRKADEMLAYLEKQGTELLEKLVAHIDTASIADVVKQLVGADNHNSFLPMPAMSQWLADTPLVDLLLARLAESYSPETRASAAEILTATAHTQPSPLAGRLSEHASIAVLVEHALAPGRGGTGCLSEHASITVLVEHALAPGRRVLVPALDVCIALIEPHRAALRASRAAQLAFQMGGAAGALDSVSDEAVAAARAVAVSAVAQHLQRLVETLSVASATNTQQTQCGLLTPPLGRNRLKVIELLAVLMRSGCEDAEDAVASCAALPVCLGLFAAYPLNNVLHHHIESMLVAGASSRSAAMLSHLFDRCKLLDWIVALPLRVRPRPNPGCEDNAAAKEPLRAGYLGHVTRMGTALERLSAGDDRHGGRGRSKDGEVDGPSASDAGRSPVAAYTAAHAGWACHVAEVLHPQLELESIDSWRCGRPSALGLRGMVDDDRAMDFDTDMEQAGSVQPLYPHYDSGSAGGTYEDAEGDDEDGSSSGDSAGDPDPNGTDEFHPAFEYHSEVVSEMSGMDMNLMYQPIGVPPMIGTGAQLLGGDPRGAQRAAHCED